jgi:double-stranded uracil-DNA glycosylase
MAADKTLPDLGGPGLHVLFVGINPGTRSAQIGHHFGGPGNRFWAALELSGFTPRRLLPEQDAQLPRYGLGLTNLVDRPSRTASELGVEELRAGAEALERRVAAWAPRLAAIVGVTAYRRAFARPRARLGLQDETIAGRPVWVLPNPSGLNAHHQLPELAWLFAQARAYAETLGSSSS